MKKLLFITHDVTQTGAPILLLNLIRLLKESGDYTAKIIIKNSHGILLQQFQNAGEVLVWQEQKPTGLFQKITSIVLKKLRQFNRNNKQIQAWLTECDVVISNTITNGDFLTSFDLSAVKLLITYVHELEIATNFFSTPENVQVVKRVSNGFMVPCNAVQLHLKSNLNIPENNISHLNYYIPFATNNPVAPDCNPVFWAGLVGTFDWRKGADILPLLMQVFYKKYPDVNLLFVWKGADKNTIAFKRACYELKKLNLLNKILFEDSSADMDSFYQSVDVLVLLSKEDPYPLVVLEAACNNKPTICFDGAGGAPEFVRDDAGTVVPFLAIETMADTLFAYCSNRKQCIQKGIAANARYHALHYNKQLILNQFKEALKN